MSGSKNTKPTTPNTELREKLQNLFKDAFQDGEDGKELRVPGLAEQYVDKVMVAFEAQLSEARIDELSQIICHKHGFGKDSCPQIKKRIAQLNPQKPPTKQLPPNPEPQISELCADCSHRYDWHRGHGWCNAQRYSQTGHCPCYEFKQPGPQKPSNKGDKV